MSILRDFTRGNLLTVHLVDATTVVGAFVRRSRRSLVLEHYSIEANGTMHAMKGDRLVVPLGNIKIVEVSQL